MRIAVAALLTLLLHSAAPAGLDAPDSGAARPAEPPTQAVEAIRAGEMMSTVGVLAGPRLQGRLAGSPGYMRAADIMATFLTRAGATPAGEERFFQKLDVEYNEIPVCRLARVLPDGSLRPWKLGEDFAARGYTGSGTATAQVVFVGYGVSQPAKGYDDYAGVDVRGRIVLAFKEPPPFQVDTTGWGETTLPRPKGRVAAAHGAVGLLIVPVPGQPHPQKPIGSVLEGDAPQDTTFPRLQVDESVAADLLAASGLDLATLKARIDSTRAPASRELAAKVRLEVQAHYTARQPSVNVVGMFPGSDSVLQHQYVVVGAHLDHVGSQGGEIYFPGANDNASGSAAVIAIARAFATAPRARRTVIFGLWSSEEAGLLGAKRFVERPPVPRDSIVAYINLDCVGHGDSIQVGGGKSYPKLWRMVRDLDRDGANLLVEETWKGGGADAEPFERHGIPNLYFASKFSYTHLHRPTDTPETLNPPLLQAVGRLAFRTAWMLANAGSRPLP